MHFICIIIVPKKVFESERNLVRKYINLVMECNTDICDWHVVGGRWDGFFKESYKHMNTERFNFGEEYQMISNNSISITNLIKMYKNKQIERKINIIDTNMIYHDICNFNINNYSDFLEKFIDSYAINLDCHI